MPYLPGVSPSRQGRGRSPFLGWITAVLVAIALFVIIRVRTFGAFIFSACIFLVVFTIQKMSQADTSKVTVQVSVIGVVWFHPMRGGGTLAWGNIGALSVRENSGRGDLALSLIPVDMDKGTAMMVDSSELASGPEGRGKLAELAGDIMRHLPPEAVMDRSTRAWAERMGLSRGKG